MKNKNKTIGRFIISLLIVYLIFTNNSFAIKNIGIFSIHPWEKDLLILRADGISVTLPTELFQIEGRLAYIGGSTFYQTPDKKTSLQIGLDLWAIGGSIVKVLKTDQPVKFYLTGGVDVIFGDVYSKSTTEGDYKYYNEYKLEVSGIVLRPGFGMEYKFEKLKPLSVSVEFIAPQLLYLKMIPKSITSTDGDVDTEEFGSVNVYFRKVPLLVFYIRYYFY